MSDNLRPIRFTRFLAMWIAFFLYSGTITDTGWAVPESRVIKCRITRDTGISSAKGEETGNKGGSSKLKLKGQQESVLMDIDPGPLKGKIVTRALFHIRSGSPEKARLKRVGVSTVASEWVEGTSKWYRPQIGSSCYAQAGYQTRDWAYPGSTLMDVVFGRGHTLWKFADCSPPDPDGWQVCPADPDVVSARAAGLSYGFSLYDEVGNEWSLRNRKFRFVYFPNRFCYARESWGSDPWLEVRVSESDTVPPEPVRAADSDTEGLPSGEALVRWLTPKDRGPGKTLGFQVFYQREGKPERVMPRYLIPMAGRPGEEVRMHIQDVPFTPGETITLTIQPVDSAGNPGKRFTKSISLSPGYDMPDVPEPEIQPFPSDTRLSQVNSLRVAVTDLVDKTDPKTGKMIPPRPKGYKGGNHIFSAKQKQIRLYAARNETVAFQINLDRGGKKSYLHKNKEISVNCQFDSHPGLNPKLYQFEYVNVTDKQGNIISVLPDPLIPVQNQVNFGFRDSDFGFSPDSAFGFPSLLCEIYIPHETPPGKKEGTVVISVGKESLELDVDLWVWNFTLPDKLSFIPEMNAYATVSPYRGYAYYRLAHEHRVCLNRLPYGWNGVPDFAPEWKGDEFDWEEWDQKVGPLLDGSAFNDLPRKGEPVDVFYLPFSENWPVTLSRHYQFSYWADEAFSKAYETGMKKAYAAFAKHCDEKGWHDTIFQFYLNNKVYYRKTYSRSAAPWIFDEPVNTQDFWSLRWYGLLWRSAVDPIRGKANMWYRGDISYTQFGRNILWGITDIEYLGGNNAQKTRMKQDERFITGNAYFAEYGTPNKISGSNMQPVLWCLSAWTKGATGVLPWQTIGGKNCWKTGEQTALFYPHPKGPMPSVRLKAFTRGQQDTEYLTLFCHVFNLSRVAADQWLNKKIQLKRTVFKSSEADAGTLAFDKVDPADLWRIRYAIGKMISEKGPAYKRSLNTRKTRRWEAGKRPNIGMIGEK